LVSGALKEKSLTGNAQAMVNDIEDLQEEWDTLDMCYDRPEKYITEDLEPFIKVWKYRAFENGTIREFYSLLSTTRWEHKGRGCYTISLMIRHCPA
jgi:hypothetical protein